MAEPGEVIQLGAGEFEPFWTPTPVIIRGAGSDKTAILYPVGTRFAIEMRKLREESSAGGVEALRIGMKLPEEGAEFYGAWYAVEISGGGTIRDVVIGPWDGSAVSLKEGVFSVRHLRVENAKSSGLVFSAVEKGSLVDGLTVSGTGIDGFDLEVGNYSVVTFRNLELTGDGNGAIVVKGDSNAVVFEDLDSFTRNDILFEGGATPEGIPADEVLEAYFESEVYMEENEVSQGSLFKESWLSDSERRKVARDYGEALAKAVGVDAHAAALVAYINALSPLCDGSGPQAYFINTLRIELTEFIAAHGLAAFKEIFFDLPSRGRDKWEYYPPYVDNKSWEAELWDWAASPPTEVVSEPTIDQTKWRREELDRILAQWDAPSADPSEQDAVMEQSLQAVRKIFGGAWREDEGKALEATLRDRIGKIITDATESGDTTVLVALLAGLPTLEDEVLPTQRETMRDLPAALRKEVLQGLRNR